MLVVADVIEVCVLFSIPIVDNRLRDVVTEGYDHRAEVGFDGTESVTYIYQKSFIRVTGTHNDTATLASDFGSVFSFTTVDIASRLLQTIQSTSPAG